jgi:hypothetical protein
MSLFLGSFVTDVTMITNEFELPLGGIGITLPIPWIPCHCLSYFLAASGIYYLVVAYTKLRVIALVEDAKECRSSKPLV